MPNRVAVFSGPPLVYAAGRIAYVSRDAGDGSGELSVTDVRGRVRDFASFQTPETLEAFAFDGTRLASAHTVYRPDLEARQGAEENAPPRAPLARRAIPLEPGDREDRLLLEPALVSRPRRLGGLPPRRHGAARRPRSLWSRSGRLARCDFRRPIP
jgi:hypothetical protein